MTPRPLTSADVAAAAQLACLLEVSAPKPWNVSPGRHFANLRFEDFLAGAAAIGEPLSRAHRQPLGATVREAVDAAAHWTQSNSNLGIVLLLAPLTRAALLSIEESSGGGEPIAAFSADLLRHSVQRVLEATTIDDAVDVYAAIRQASPGGLGSAGTQDVAHTPTMTLLEVMRLAADRDGIAREYATGFATTFDGAAPALDRARRDGLSWDDAIVETFLTLLATTPDTHIVRRSGEGAAALVSRHAGEALAAGGVRTDAGRSAIAAMDRTLRDPQNSSNPGTTADLLAAAIFVVILCGGWRHRDA